jgi:hypothetical protein
MQDRPMQRMASALRDDATMLERIDHRRRNYTLDHGTRLWAGESCATPPMIFGS